MSIWSRHPSEPSSPARPRPDPAADRTPPDAASSPRTDENVLLSRARELFGRVDAAPGRPHRSHPTRPAGAASQERADAAGGADEQAPAQAEAPGSGDDTGRAEALMRHVRDLILLLHSDGRIVYASPASEEILGTRAADGPDLIERIHPDDRAAFGAALSGGAPPREPTTIEIRVRSSDGSWRHLEGALSDERSDPALRGMVLVARDVTEEVGALAALAALAYTDRLTNLPNRSRLLQRLEALMQTAEPRAPALLLADIDRLKQLNDAHGSPVVDGALVEISRRIVDAAGQGAFVARVRSDEFAVLLSDCDSPAAAVETADRLRAAISRPLETDDRRLELTASVGVALAEGVSEPETLLDHAIGAMRRAKSTGRNRTVLFGPELARSESRRHDAERLLRDLLDGAPLPIAYQPVVGLADLRLAGAEALLRVSGPRGEAIWPTLFIEVAEASGAMTRLGDSVLRTVCEQLAGWHGPSEHPSTYGMSVNVSPRQLLEPTFAGRVASILDESGVQADRLWLEITEHTLTAHDETLEANLVRLRDVGVRVGLDEFGRGQMSLAHLRRYPLDFLKIDRALIAGLGSNFSDTAIVRALADLARTLGLTVVAVGVETQDQLDLLRQYGCDRAQGYLFSAPVPPKLLVDLADEWQI